MNSRFRSKQRLASYSGSIVTKPFSRNWVTNSQSSRSEAPSRARLPVAKIRTSRSLCCQIIVARCTRTITSESLARFTVRLYSNGSSNSSTNAGGRVSSSVKPVVRYKGQFDVTMITKSKSHRDKGMKIFYMTYLHDLSKGGSFHNATHCRRDSVPNLDCIKKSVRSVLM